MSKPSLNTKSDHPMVSVKDLSVTFGEITVLSHVNFAIERGKIVAIIGPNGSGKTTLIRAILGLVPSESGEVLIDGQPLFHMQSRIGYLPQRLQIDTQFPITVKEFLSLTLHAGMHSSLTEILREVGLTSSILSKRLGSLSGGQLQRVLIAQATMHRPSLLILDEPSTGIDVVGEKQFYDLIQHQRDTYNATILIVSHDLSAIARVVDQVVCINKRLVCFGAPTDALTKETLFELYGKQERSLFHHRH